MCNLEKNYANLQIKYFKLLILFIMSHIQESFSKALFVSVQYLALNI